MSDTEFPLDYGEALVLRYGRSGMTRKEFAAQSGISVSTLDYYIRRERKAAIPSGFTPNRILPVDLVACAEEFAGPASGSLPGGIAIRLANGRTVEVRRGFDAQVLRDVLAVVDTQTIEERV